MFVVVSIVMNQHHESVKLLLYVIMIWGVGDVAVLLFPCLKLWFLARSMSTSLHLQLTSNQHGNLTGADLHSLPDYQLNHNGKSASMHS